MTNLCLVQSLHDICWPLNLDSVERYQDLIFLGPVRTIYVAISDDYSAENSLLNCFPGDC